VVCGLFRQTDRYGECGSVFVGCTDRAKLYGEVGREFVGFTDSLANIAGVVRGLWVVQTEGRIW
jgi:hypothetical protein